MTSQKNTPANELQLTIGNLIVAIEDFRAAANRHFHSRLVNVVAIDHVDIIEDDLLMILREVRHDA